MPHQFPFRQPSHTMTDRQSIVCGPGRCVALPAGPMPDPHGGPGPLRIPCGSREADGGRAQHSSAGPISLFSAAQFILCDSGHIDHCGPLHSVQVCLFFFCAIHYYIGPLDFFK